MLIGVFTSSGVIHYVDVAGAAPTPPYTNWSMAATTIQDAVDVASPGDLILVTNGVYETGGRAVNSPLTNRVVVTRDLTLQSVNGPAVTIIRGYQVSGTTNGDGAVRCAYLATNATLSGFTLTEGATCATGDWSKDRSGGGVWCESRSAMITNCWLLNSSAYQSGGGAWSGLLIGCLIRGNQAYSGGGIGDALASNCVFTANSANSDGGGALGGGLSRCILTGNKAYMGGAVQGAGCDNCLIVSNSASHGGGLYSGSASSCTIVFNSAYQGGGASGGSIYNSIIYYNSAQLQPNCTGGTVYSCTALSAPGMRSITNEPRFVDMEHGDFRLQSTSPCINSGWNQAVRSGPDLDGQPRVAGGAIDIGAYEFPNPASTISYAWLQEHELPTDGSADLVDPDGDGISNWLEWGAGTNPHDPSSLLKIVSLSADASGITVQWQSVTNRSYFVQRSTNLVAQTPFRSIRGYIDGRPGVTAYTDTNAVGAGPFIYRVGVH